MNRMLAPPRLSFRPCSAFERSSPPVRGRPPEVVQQRICGRFAHHAENGHEGDQCRKDRQHPVIREGCGPIGDVVLAELAERPLENITPGAARELRRPLHLLCCFDALPRVHRLPCVLERERQTSTGDLSVGRTEYYANCSEGEVIAPPLTLNARDSVAPRYASRRHPRVPG